jgi:hypothetical protein
MRRAFLFLALSFAMPVAARQEQVFGEAIDVVRYNVPARVVDSRGDPITGLAPADFTATIGGRKATVESVVRLRDVLAGYYELVLRLDEPLPPGEYRVALRTSRARANVVTAPLTVIRTGEPGASEIVEIADPTPPPVSATRLYLDALRNLRDGDAAEADALLTRAIALGDAPHESWYERALLRAARSFH